MKNLFIIALLASGLTFSCGGGESQKPGGDSTNKAGTENTQAGNATAAPNKETAIALLNTVSEALNAQSWDAALAHFNIPAELDATKATESIKKLVENQEISRDGVKIIAEKGSWQTLAEAKGEERAGEIAKSFGANAADCYMLTYENAEAGFSWKDGAFKIIRLNNLGKLEAPKEEAH